jgi:hypothetical protein
VYYIHFTFSFCMLITLNRTFYCDALYFLNIFTTRKIINSAPVYLDIETAYLSTLFGSSVPSSVIRILANKGRFSIENEEFQSALFDSVVSKFSFSLWGEFSCSLFRVVALPICHIFYV